MTVHGPSENGHAQRPGVRTVSERMSIGMRMAYRVIARRQ
jgi:hypothetical protein